MEKLHFPAGCIIEGDIRAITNEGDILLEGDFAPQQLISNQGNVHFKPAAETVHFQVMRAPNGTLLVEAGNLIGRILEGDAVRIHSQTMKIEERVTGDEVDLQGDQLEIEHVNGGTIRIRAKNLTLEKLVSTGEVHIEADMAKVVEARAHKLVLRGAFNSQKVVAEDVVIAESGKVAIKMLDAPRFQAASDVRGIVMISTCSQVKAEGVRGFLHPDELSMLNEEANTLDLTNYIDRREALRQEAVAYSGETVSHDHDESDTDDTDDTDGTVKVKTEDLKHFAHVAADDRPTGTARPEEMVLDAPDEESSLEMSDEPVLSDEIADTPGAYTPVAFDEVQDDIQTESLEEGPALDMDDAEIPASDEGDLVDADDIAFESDTDPDDVFSGGEPEVPGVGTQGEVIETFDTASSDEASDEDLPTGKSAADFGDWDGPAALEDDSVDQDATPAEDLQADFNAFRADAEPASEAWDDVSARAGAQPASEAWQDNAVDHDDWAAVDTPSSDAGWEEVSSPVAETVLNTDSTELDDEDVLESEPGSDVDDFDGDLDVPTEDDEQLSPNAFQSVNGDDDAEELSSEDLDELPAEGTIDDSLPEVAAFDAGTSGNMEALGSEDLLEVDEPETPADPEDLLVENLNAKLEEVKRFFADDDYPKFIGQLQRYIEDRRFNLFAKQRNREAVLASFDKFNREDISQLARAFFQILDDHFNEHGGL